MKTKLYRITVSYACFNVIADDKGNVVRAAPIAGWTVGKRFDYIAGWYKSNKNAVVEEVP